MTGCGGIHIRDVFYWISIRPYELIRYNIYIDTIRRLQVNILFICTSFKNRRKTSLWLDFLSFSETRVQMNFIFLDNVRIFCLYCSFMSAIKTQISNLVRRTRFQKNLHQVRVRRKRFQKNLHQVRVRRKRFQMNLHQVRVRTTRFQKNLHQVRSNPKYLKAKYLKVVSGQKTKGPKQECQTILDLHTNKKTKTNWRY